MITFPIIIISGGQTGADQGGLAGAKVLGIKTGGTAPLHYRTDEGNNPSLLRDVYGLKESKYWAYPPRTKDNVRDSDATLWVGKTTSPGFYCTKKACDSLGKQMFINPSAAELRAYCQSLNVAVLNVAGNREKSNPGIHDRTRDLIVEACKVL